VINRRGYVRRRTPVVALAIALSVGGLSTAFAVPASAAAASLSSSASISVASDSGASTAPVLEPVSGPSSTSSAFKVQNFASSLCVGIAGGDIDAEAVQFNCLAHPDQSWVIGSEYGDTGYFQLENADKMCLGVLGGVKTQGAEVVGWSCGGTTHPDQYWGWVEDTNINSSCVGYYALKNLNSGYVLGVAAASLDSGAELVQFRYQDECNNQYWIAPLIS
jgi:hypothetical protein